MKQFFIGLATGMVAGGGVLLAVHPMSRREMKKACRRAGRIIRKVNCTLTGNMM